MSGEINQGQVPVNNPLPTSISLADESADEGKIADSEGGNKPAPARRTYQKAFTTMPVRRVLSTYTVTEAELLSLDAAKSISSWFGNAASGLVIFVLGLLADMLIQGQLSDVTKATFKILIPLLLVGAAICGLIWFKGRRDLKANLKRILEPEVHELS